MAIWPEIVIEMHEPGDPSHLDPPSVCPCPWRKNGQNRSLICIGADPDGLSSCSTNLMPLLGVGIAAIHDAWMRTAGPFPCKLATVASRWLNIWLWTRHPRRAQPDAGGRPFQDFGEKIIETGFLAKLPFSRARRCGSCPGKHSPRLYECPTFRIAHIGLLAAYRAAAKPAAGNLALIERAGQDLACWQAVALAVLSLVSGERFPSRSSIRSRVRGIQIFLTQGSAGFGLVPGMLPEISSRYNWRLCS